jgi:hypothetical protein
MLGAITTERAAFADTSLHARLRTPEAMTFARRRPS